MNCIEWHFQTFGNASNLEIVRGQTEILKNKQMQSTELSRCCISGPRKVTQSLMLTYLIQPPYDIEMRGKTLLKPRQHL